MDAIIQEFWKGRERKKPDGQCIATTLSTTVDPERLRRFVNSANAQSIKPQIQDRIRYDLSGRRCNCSKDEADGWGNIYEAFWKAASEIVVIQDGRGKSSWSTVYEAWKDVVLNVSRGFTNYNFERWALPVLEATARDLRILALKADDERNNTNTEDTPSFGDDFDLEGEKHQKLEDCARQLNRLFTLCLNDRAELERSRKWSIYYIINLLFKTYFRLNKASLSRNLIKALLAYRGDMPELTQFKVSEVVTFQYFQGVLEFLEENYVKAEDHLTEAFFMCHRDCIGNKERILTYLIPCHLLTSHSLPSDKLLAPFPKLQSLFGPLSTAIKHGNLKAFDEALQECEDEFVQRRIYLTLERGRDIALRNLLRRVFLAGGLEEGKNGGEPIRRTRVPVSEFQAAVSLVSGEAVDADEVECLLANMIYKNLMKGYIAHDRGIVVLSKAGAFPGTKV
ncbi:protein CSN12 [Zalerion maritima]|uniref:Protein CSN12 homolog n=1 Tax=Zalerion maritima TaxID=339359 RepID=A0AAD5RWR1_9PEZI|nr:protein CSN12 [Zalerion maritima]